MSMPVPPPVDPSVLGKILLIQTTIHAITSQVSIAEFICRGLEEMPGTSGVAVRIHDIVRAAPPALAGLLRNASDSGQDALQEARSGSTAQPPAKRPPGGPVVIGIRTIHRRYGAILFDRSAENVLSPYLPFLESLATTIALTLENQDHAEALKRLNDELLLSKEGLEAQVRERTIDLVTANAALAKEIEERKRFEQKLRQAQKMEAIGTLAGGIAHDFNNILSAIIGYSEMARMRLPEDHEVSGHLEEVMRAGNRAGELVRQILTISRPAGEERSALQLQPIIKEALKFLRASIPASVEIVQDISAGTPQVLADPTQVHQVIMNLCTNAYHAMQQAGGVLRVALSPVTLDAKTSSPDAPAPGDYALLEVSDTGCGMGSETLERIFDPYFTTKEKGRGTGLGLSVVHGIVQSFGGHITVVSQPGSGSSFRVYLPASEAGGAPRKAPDTPPLRGNERIWVIDDELSIALLEKEMLENLGYRVRCFTNGPDLAQAFAKDPAGCDLIISDMGMPKMNGAELARKVLSIRSDLPIIICTGFSDSLSKEQALAMGIRDYIMKPVHFEHLGRSVRAVMDGR